VWVEDLAERFWAAAGPPPPFPRDLAAAATAGLPVRVVSLAALRLDGVRGWLARCGVPCPAGGPDRPLRACLFARAGFGFVFLDATDPADERRFSLAHEVAHVLRDYDAPRRLAAARLGPDVLAVLDGRRPPTVEERVHAALRQVEVGPHVHLLRRDADGEPREPAERAAEDAADRLAFELLAPAGLLAVESGVRAAERRLRAEFGLPAAAALAYAAALFPAAPTDPFVARLTSCWLDGGSGR
jgi:hypothetical protein